MMPTSGVIAAALRFSRRRKMKNDAREQAQGDEAGMQKDEGAQRTQLANGPCCDQNRSGGGMHRGC